MTQIVIEASSVAPHRAAKLLKVLKRFFSWCMGRGIIELSPAAGIPSPVPGGKRDRVLTDEELAAVLRAAHRIGRHYGAIVELLALTGQRRDEVARMTGDELDVSKRMWTLPAHRSKNGKPHFIHLSEQAAAIIDRMPRLGTHVFSHTGAYPFDDFGRFKITLDQLSGVRNWVLHDLRRTCVSGMARLGVPPHIADKILNHQSGTLSGVAAVYQRHEFLAERKEALDLWGSHISKISQPCGRGEYMTRPSQVTIRLPVEA